MPSMKGLASRLQSVLEKSNLIPAWTPRVEICLAPGKERKIRKVRKDARSWHEPADYILVVQFELANEAPQPVDPISRVVQVLADLELRSGLPFISLKKFRDYHLPEATGWPPPDCDAALREAIVQGLVRTKKVPNPNRPFPTAAIESNRQHSRVQQVVGPQTRPLFQPVAIKGKPLSDTILLNSR
jgi:hypothetical protein